MGVGEAITCAVRARWGKANRLQPSCSTGSQALPEDIPGCPPGGGGGGNRICSRIAARANSEREPTCSLKSGSMGPQFREGCPGFFGAGFCPGLSDLTQTNEIRPGPKDRRASRFRIPGAFAAASSGLCAVSDQKKRAGRWYSISQHEFARYRPGSTWQSSAM